MFSLNSNVKRHSEALLFAMLSESPIVAIEGARQVGKSTLANSVSETRESYYVTLDDEETADFAAAAPSAFLAQAPGKLLIVDEAQREPKLILALKAAVDRERRAGQFLITGSSDFLEAEGVSDSLAGRVEILSLRPFSVGEALDREKPEDWVAWLLQGALGTCIPDSSDSTREIILAGGYPIPLRRDTFQSRSRWFTSYLRGIVTKDARMLASGEFSRLLPRLLNLIAAEGQSELVKSKIARQLDVSEKSLSAYLDLAQQMYLVDTLPSWGVGMSGRVVRRPKVALSDTGMAAHLAGMTIEKSRLVGGQEFFGALTEQFVCGELRKQQTWSAQDFRLYHYRHRNDEIDLLIELFDGRIIAVEVKSAMNVPRDAWTRMARILDDKRVVARVVFYLGEQFQRRGDGNYLMPISALWRHPSL